MSAYVLELDAVLGPGTWIDVELPTRALLSTGQEAIVVPAAGAPRGVRCLVVCASTDGRTFLLNGREYVRRAEGGEYELEPLPQGELLPAVREWALAVVARLEEGRPAHAVSVVRDHPPADPRLWPAFLAVCGLPANAAQAAVEALGARATSAPTPADVARCVLHWAVADGSCPRCGAFWCARCRKLSVALDCCPACLHGGRLRTEQPRIVSIEALLVALGAAAALEKLGKLAVVLGWTALAVAAIALWLEQRETPARVTWRHLEFWRGRALALVSVVIAVGVLLGR